MTRSLTTIEELVRSGLVAKGDSGKLRQVAERYAVAIPPALAELIDPSDPDDPIAKQFVPSLRELETTDDERADPIGDDWHSPVPGIVHRYRDRALLKLTHVCPVYCRFCFRREMVGAANGTALSKAQLDAAIEYIKRRDEIWEVIFTGGDPLILPPRKLADTVRRIGAIEHVKILRWHTRMPVAKPSAITAELVAAMKAARKTTYVVLHTNHPRELTEEARAACARIIEAGIPVLSQSVLLKGVNDDVLTLEALMRALVETGVKPYYLHHADLAPGTAHFRTSIEDGQRLMRELHARASGLCLPTYVLDIPGGFAKARLEPGDAEPIAADSGQDQALYSVRDSADRFHTYPPRK